MGISYQLCICLKKSLSAYYENFHNAFVGCSYNECVKGYREKQPMFTMRDMEGLLKAPEWLNSNVS